MSNAIPEATVQSERHRITAPSVVRDRGGVALSLWMTGAGETDCIIVAQMSDRLEQVERAAGVLIDTLDRGEYTIPAQPFYALKELL